jgi:2-oxoglutarate ferredoxin oxidoreductase subunit alpha
MSGNQALALGFVTAAQKSGLTLFQGSYPITPASDILHELSMYKDFGVMTFQAEDEIAAITSAIGAAYGGALAITTTSGPGMALKTEAMGLAVAVEIPLVICDIQRGGPSWDCQPKPDRPAQALRPQLRSPHSRSRSLHSGRLFWVAIEATRIAVSTWCRHHSRRLPRQRRSRGTRS